MPLLTITTNVTVPAEEREKTISAASALVAELLEKPETYVMVRLDDDATITFGGTSKPTCLLQLKSLGFPEDRTKCLSERLCDFVDGYLGVDSNRTYIEFVNPPRHMWGFDRRTFQR